MRIVSYALFYVRICNMLQHETKLQGIVSLTMWVFPKIYWIQWCQYRLPRLRLSAQHECNTQFRESTAGRIMAQPGRKTKDNGLEHDSRFKGWFRADHPVWLVRRSNGMHTNDSLRCGARNNMCSERRKNLAVFLPTILVLSTSTSTNRTYVWPNRPIRFWKRSTFILLSLANSERCDCLVVFVNGNHNAKCWKLIIHSMFICLPHWDVLSIRV